MQLPLLSLQTSRDVRYFVNGRLWANGKAVWAIKAFARNAEILLFYRD